MREEEKNRSSQDSRLKKFFKKRWVFPAVYIASAALILTAVLWYQNSSTDNAIDSDKFDYNATDVPGKDFKEPALEVNRSFENVVLPLTAKDRDRAVIQKKFYDDSAKAEEQEAALVVYKNQYHPNTGIDITVKDSEAFDVVAALSGTVTKVEEDAFLGNVIVIEHEDDIVTQYQSVKDIKVKVGDEIEQGQAIAMAGQSVFNEEAGVHVHFEIRKNDVPVNPESYLNKPLSDIQEAADKKDEAIDQGDATGDNGVSEEEDAELQDDSTKDDAGSEGQKDSTDSSDSKEQKDAPSDDNADKDKMDETTNNTQNKDA